MTISVGPSPADLSAERINPREVQPHLEGYFDFLDRTREVLKGLRSLLPSDGKPIKVETKDFGSVQINRGHGSVVLSQLDQNAPVRFPDGFLVVGNVQASLALEHALRDRFQGTEVDAPGIKALAQLQKDIQELALAERVLREQRPDWKSTTHLPSL